MNKKYHTYEAHIKPMLDFIDNNLYINGKCSESKIKILKLAAIFHDCVYIPGSKTNEDDSIEAFKYFCTEGLYNNHQNIPVNLSILHKEANFLKDIVLIREDCNFATYNELQLSKDEYNKIIELINNTKNPFDIRYGDELGHIFAKLDVYGLTQDFHTLMINEHRIYNEFKDFYSLKEYKQGRVDFLNKVIKEIPNANILGIENLIEYVNTRDYGSLGIFAGSFNPFTIGHNNVLEQAKNNFNSIVVVKMQNLDKLNQELIDLPKLEGVKTMWDGGTLVDLVNKLKEGYSSVSVIRALRNSSDLQYEQNLKALIYDFDKNIKFVYYLADSEFNHVSSSMVRNLPIEIRSKYLV
jgi:pantetheine-phosphate adenylyltransferase